MSTVMIDLPEELRVSAERAAQEQGTSIEALLRDLLAEYLEDLADARDAEEIIERIRNGDEETYPWEQVKAELEA